MSSLIGLGSNNVVANNYNNVYVHEFRGSAINLQNAEIAIQNVAVLNSVYNIDSAVYSNNTLSIDMPTGATVSTVTITIPDGLYPYADLNNYIQSQLKAAGAYLIDNNSLDVHYFQLSENSVYYAAQVDVSPVPTSLPVGWSRPAAGLYSTGGTGFPTTTRVPRLNITNASFGKVIGFSAGTYPSSPQTTLQSLLSNITPQAHPITTYRIRCSIVNNPYMFPSDILGTFTAAGVVSGKLIDYRPNEYMWVSVPDASYASIRITITDQNDNFVRLREPANIVLAIKSKK